MNIVENTEQALAAPKARQRRKSTDIPQSGRDRLTERQNEEYSRLLMRTEVKEALFDVQSAQAKRDSISRKLCAGSSAVTVDDLARWESALSDGHAVLHALADKNPLLFRHPLLALKAGDDLSVM